MQDGFDRLAHKRRRGLGWLVIMLCLLLGVAAFGASLGAAHLGVGKSLQILLARLTHDQALLAAFKPSEIAIVWDIRLPRLCLLYTSRCV